MSFIDDVWSEIPIFCIDIFTYSQAEQNKDKYREVVKKLTRKISSCEGSLADAKQMGRDLDQSFRSNSWTARGEWKTKFSEKEAIWDQEKDELITFMENALDRAKERKAKAEELAAYWEGEERAEEQRVRNQVYAKQREREEEERRRSENG